MRGAFGKPTGVVARVDIGDVLITVRSKDSAKAAVVEALRRASMKCPGRQKVVVSTKWGFTKLDRDDYVDKRQSGEIVPDGANVKFAIRNPFILEKKMAMSQ